MVTGFVNRRAASPGKATQMDASTLAGNEGRTELFLLRLWVEQDGSESAATSDPLKRHGRVLNVLSGEAHNFSDWQRLVEVLSSLVSDGAAEG
jgi:hypothetical protein